MVDFENADEWLAALKVAVDGLELRSTADLQRVAILTQNNARRDAPVDTGRLRSSIVHVMGEDARGPYADVGTNVEYAPHVEFGTQHQAAQPFMRPAVLAAAETWQQRAG